ncbi:hypothetical protein WR25_19311 isoform A [Diploscapter pachys]|uniref:R3H domain-containing protein n=1 Tax=Diploscapter pachys TaxID=2018661 RepID=A0A2A2JUY7_9BILA|nr:hypothetical protein WR25_19311 isoform A [Diploscapter pachys]
MQSDMENTEENLQENIENEDLNGVKGVIVKRRLSKMTATIDEPSASQTTCGAANQVAVSAPQLEVQEDPEDNIPEEAHFDIDEEDRIIVSMANRPKLERSYAISDNDDTRLRPVAPPLHRSPLSWSRDSSGTEMTDSSGVNLSQFLLETLHKNPKDREKLLALEKDMKDFVQKEPPEQSKKFQQGTSYQRMLIHRVAAIFGLDHNVDTAGKAVVVSRTERTRVPDFTFESLIKPHQAYTEQPRAKSLRAMQSADEYGQHYPEHSYAFSECNYSRSFDIGSGGMPYAESVGAAENSPIHHRNVQHVPPHHHQWASHDMGFNRSFEVSASQMPPYNQVVDRGSMRRTGSFGGVPVMYRGRSADDKYYGTPGYAGSQGSMNRLSPHSGYEEMQLTEGMGNVNIGSQGHINHGYVNQGQPAYAGQNQPAYPQQPAPLMQPLQVQVPVTTHYVGQAIASLPPTGPSSVCHTNSAMSTPIPGCCQAVQQVTQGQPVYVNQAANAPIMMPYQTQTPVCPSCSTTTVIHRPVVQGNQAQWVAYGNPQVNQPVQQQQQQYVTYQQPQQQWVPTYTQQGQLQMVQPATHQPQMQVYGPAAQPQSTYAQQNSIQQQPPYQGPVYYQQQPLMYDANSDSYQPYGNTTSYSIGTASYQADISQQTSTNEGSIQQYDLRERKVRITALSLIEAPGFYF